ncbi:MAG: hypothetical protein JRH01_22770 [Deltaproteobacteria bacterium]|nr:hypothetical protein [Deltaproteobacteria bacterium]MBW2399613.1 hypothetical protein [Deltaproteobacteria bacterium]
MGRIILRYPASLTGIASLLLLTCFYWATGTLWPTELPPYANSSREITGTALMLIVLPPYFMAFVIVTQRRSLDLVEQLKPQLSDPQHADDAAAAIRGGPRRSWLAGSLAGIAMGLLNTRGHYAFTSSTTPAIDISIVFGQLLLWLLVGLVFGRRVVTAASFNRLGAVTEFDLFQLDRLKPLAWSGMMDVLMIAGALALTPLQALDAEFRWYNYSFALLIAIPASLTLLLWPLWHIHDRIRHEKARRISEVEKLITESGRIARQDQDHILQIETLLTHRDRLREQRTWPLSTALISRVFLYLIIPPLAWVGAAMVEMFVDRWIGAA